MTCDGEDATATKEDEPASATKRRRGKRPPDDGKDQASASTTPEAPPSAVPDGEAREEIGGRRKGLDPTRYGDWEKNGRAIDF